MEKLVIQSDISKLVDVERFINVVCDGFNINNYAGTISISLLQAVKNAILHGNHSDPAKQVTIVSDRCKGGVYFSVSDEGSGFDYRSFGNLPEQEEKGTGIFLMGALSDRLSFQNNGSTVRMDFLINGIEATRAVERIVTLRNYYAKKLVHA